MRTGARLGLGLGVAAGLSASALTGCGGGGPEQFTPPSIHESTTSTTIDMNAPQASDVACLAVKALNITVSDANKSSRDIQDATQGVVDAMEKDPSGTPLNTDINTGLMAVFATGSMAVNAREMDVSGNPAYTEMAMREVATSVSGGFLVERCLVMFPGFKPQAPVV